MSGLEPLVALAFACNIFEIVTFGLTSLRLCKEIKKNGTFDENLQSYNRKLQDIAKSVQSNPIDEKTLSSQEKNLVEAANGCSQVASKLTQEIDYILKYENKRSMRHAAATTVRTFWRKDRLNGLEKELSRFEKLMQSELLDIACCNTYKIEQTLKDMDTKYEYFLMQYHRGFQDKRDVVVKKLQELDQAMIRVAEDTQKIINSHVTKEVSFSMTFVQNQLDNREGDSAVKAQKEKFLASLKFVGMNERANDVSEPQARTFSWLFEEQQPNARPSSEISETTSDSSLDSTQIQTSTTSKQVPWDSFTGWLQSDNDIYCIIGKPGAGKSTLMRYIINNQVTMNLLRCWREDVTQLSHYFWRLGSTMQQNTRGMLFSLLHQLLFSQAELLEKVLLKHSLATKDEPADWSLREIKDTLDFAILNSATPICIFLDGIDELDPNEPISDLFTLLYGWLQHRPGWVKLCISGRPEHIILQSINECPRLRLEQLTRKDMKKYARSHLRFPATTDHDDKRTTYLWSKDYLVTELINKAEGVFLWLYLAIKSLNDGFAKEDGLDELHRRIELLHRGVKNLYMDMWSRQNGDEDVYKCESTLYLSLAVAATLVDSRPYYFPSAHRKISRYINGRHLSTLEVILASQDVTDDILSPQCAGPPDESYLRSLCLKAEKNIRIRCAGLLECFNQADSAELYDDAQRFYGIFTKHVVVKFKFVHRTAVDFLLETTEGNDILGQSGDLLSSKYRLVKARLAQHRLLSFQPCDEIHYRDQSMTLWTLLQYIDDLDGTKAQLSERSCEQKHGRYRDQQIELWMCWDRLRRARQMHPLDWSLPRLLQNDGCSMSLAVRVRFLNYFQYQMERRCVTTAAMIAQVFMELLNPYSRHIDAHYFETRPQGHPYTLAETLASPEMDPNWVSGNVVSSTHDVFHLTTPLTTVLHCCLTFDYPWGTQTFDSLWRTVQALARCGANPDAELHITVWLGRKPGDIRYHRIGYNGDELITYNGYYFSMDVAILVCNAVAAVQLWTYEAARDAGEDDNFHLPKIHWHKKTRPRTRIAAIAQWDDKGANVRFQRPSVRDSTTLTEMLFPRLHPSRLVSDPELFPKVRGVFDRSPSLEGGQLEVMERLGLWGRARFDVSEDVENPWKRSETAFEMLDREDAEAARAEGRNLDADEEGETQ